MHSAKEHIKAGRLFKYLQQEDNAALSFCKNYIENIQIINFPSEYMQIN